MSSDSIQVVCVGLQPGPLAAEDQLPPLIWSDSTVYTLVSLGSMRLVDNLIARIVPNEVGGGSGCTYPKMCMAGVLEYGDQMMFIWRSGWGQLKKSGLNPRFPPAIRGLWLIENMILRSGALIKRQVGRFLCKHFEWLI